MSKEVCTGIERELRALLPAGEPLRAPVEYALRGGKRARGVLLLASGEGSVPQPELVRAAASLELLHAATLVQDDIFDCSRVRRSRAAAHCVFGARIATLASDWMLAEAIRSAYRLHVQFGEALSACTQRVIAGEAREFAPAKGTTLAELRAHAAEIARGKTGELFGLALSAPALLRGGSASAARLHEAGCALGVAFQYLDDTLDLYGDASAAGKEVRRDLSAHLLTLPVLDALRMLPGSLRNTVPAGGLPLPSRVREALAQAPVREHMLGCARLQWESALEAVMGELPHREAMRRVLGGLAGTMLAVEESSLFAA